MTATQFSLLCLVVLGLNGLVFVSRARKHKGVSESDPGPAIWLALAKWVLPLFALVAIGEAFGWTELLSSFAGPHRTRPFDFVCFLALLVMLVRGSIWIFREGGAEYVADRRLLNMISSELGVKIWWLFCVIGVTLGWLFALLGLAR